MFWDNARAGDLALTEMMVAPAGAGVCREAVTKVAKAYLEAFATRSCWAERSSVIEHLTDLRTIADGSPGLAEAIGLVIDELSTWQHQHIDTIVDEGPRPGSAGPPKLRASQPKSEQLSVEMLPVAHGDCIWIEYGQPQRKHRIIIDGGPGATYPAALGNRLTRLGDDDRRFELLVVTHVDTDHIEGALRAIQERNVVFDDIWFNGWQHLGPPERGAQQGAILDLLMEGRSWNRAFDEAAVVVHRHSDDTLPAVVCPVGPRSTLLSPGPQQLASLRSEWVLTLTEEACQAWQRRTCTPNPGRPSKGILTTGAGSGIGSGNSATTAQLPTDRVSPFVFEYQDTNCLFAGDAHAPVLLSGLRRLVAEQSITRLKLDAFKLPHHGSMSNINKDLLALVDCDRFLISTNGDKYGHPDPQTVELLGSTAQTIGRLLQLLEQDHVPLALP